MPGMMDRKSGHIVTIASSAGRQGASHLTDYCASKYAARGLDSALRRELIDMGRYDKYIQLTCINPYFINTGMFDGARTSKSFMHKCMGCYLLDQNFVTQRIFDAIRYNERDVVIPQELGDALSLEHFLPYWFQDMAVVDAFDMRQFKGRH